MTIEKALEIIATLTPADSKADFAASMRGEFRELPYTPEEYDEADRIVGPLSLYAAEQRKAESDSWIARNCTEIAEGK